MTDSVSPIKFPISDSRCAGKFVSLRAQPSSFDDSIYKVLLTNQRRECRRALSSVVRSPWLAGEGRREREREERWRRICLKVKLYICGKTRKTPTNGLRASLILSLWMSLCLLLKKETQQAELTLHWMTEPQEGRKNVEIRFVCTTSKAMITIIILRQKRRWERTKTVL